MQSPCKDIPVCSYTADCLIPPLLPHSNYLLSQSKIEGL